MGSYKHSRDSLGFHKWINKSNFEWVGHWKRIKQHCYVRECNSIASQGGLRTPTFKPSGVMQRYSIAVTDSSNFHAPFGNIMWRGETFCSSSSWIPNPELKSPSPFHVDVYHLGQASTSQVGIIGYATVYWSRGQYHFELWCRLYFLSRD